MKCVPKRGGGLSLSLSKKNIYLSLYIILRKIYIPAEKGVKSPHTPPAPKNNNSGRLWDPLLAAIAQIKLRQK